MILLLFYLIYNIPFQAVVEQGNDLIIVGRGITAASDPEAEAAKYAKSGYEALQNRA